MKKIIVISIILICLAFFAVQPGFIQTLRGVYGVATGTFGFGMTNGDAIMLSWPDGKNWVWITLTQNGKTVGDLMSKARDAASFDYPTMALKVQGLTELGWRDLGRDELQPLSGIVRNLLAWIGIPGFAGIGTGALALKRRARK